MRTAAQSNEHEATDRVPLSTLAIVSHAYNSTPFNSYAYACMRTNLQLRAIDIYIYCRCGQRVVLCGACFNILSSCICHASARATRSNIKPCLMEVEYMSVYPRTKLYPHRFIPAHVSVDNPKARDFQKSIRQKFEIYTARERKASLMPFLRASLAHVSALLH